MKKFAAIIALSLSLCAANFDRDLYQMLAIDAESRADYNASADYRKALFDDDGRIENRDLWLEALVRSDRNDEAIVAATKMLAVKEDRVVRRFRALAFYGKKDFKRAIADAKTLAAQSKTAEDFLMLGDLYSLGGDPKNALAAYRKSYAIRPSEIAIDKTADILVNKMRNTKDAIAYYETHISQFGCSDYLCSRLAALYAKENKIDGVARTYKRIYEREKDETLGRKIAELYLIDKDYKALMDWLEKTHSNDELLFEIYKVEKEYAKAVKLSKKLYKNTGKIDYLAQGAMLEYESVKKPSKALIKRTVASLEKVVKVDQNHIYLNYLGYILIDHNINPKRGVKLVKQALKIEPENIFYLDSLAWGKYKLGEFKEALKIIKKVKAKEGKDPTVKEHYNAIKKSYEKSIRKPK